MRDAPVMSQSTIVSPEVIARVQSEQLRLVIMLADLQRVAKARHDERLDQVVGPLVDSLRRHMGLVDGILDALVPDDLEGCSRFLREGSSPSTRRGA
jgi:hypothetical protein